MAHSPRLLINLVDEDSDEGIPGIPGVTRLGIKRRHYTAPSRLQAITSDHIQLPRKLDFSRTDKPLTPFANSDDHLGVKERGKPLSISQNRQNAAVVVKEEPFLTSFVNNRGDDDTDVRDGSKTKREKKMDVLQVNERIQEEVSVLKRQFSNHTDAFKRVVSEKDTLIMKLETEISDLKGSLQELTQDKESMLVRHNTEMQKVQDIMLEASTQKDNLLARHNREVESLKDSLIELNTEQERLVMRQNREVDDLRTSFSIEKALIEDRHRQQMATYRSEILNVVLQQTTQHQEAQSSVIQVTRDVDTSGGIGKQVGNSL